MGVGGGSLSLVLKYPGGNVENWLPINCNWGNKYGGNPKNYLHLDTLIISLTVIFNYRKTEFLIKNKWNSLGIKFYLWVQHEQILGTNILQNEIGTARWNSKIHFEVSQHHFFDGLILAHYIMCSFENNQLFSNH